VSTAASSMEKPTSPEKAKADISRPLLEASALHRRLGGTAAVSDISLQLAKGDALGLLGLNGAGKSTTLKMLCGMLTPDSGTVTINGHSLQEEPLAARAQIGFLPDQPPLYNDMRVNEYLRLCARIRRLRGDSLRSQFQAVVEQCDLGDVQKKIIGTLSKGYRQRVGLAQAMIHKPPVLLLDEPSNGLDPQQLDGMRQLIRTYAQHHAVVFSTHLLSEAKATCNRVAIIHQGKLVADRSADGADLESLFRGATE